LIAASMGALFLAGLAALPVASGSRPPSPVFFESGRIDSAPAVAPAETPAPRSPSLHHQRVLARRSAVSFISQERFDEALTLIRKQPPEIRGWAGLAALEAGLVSASDPAKALEMYYRVINGESRDRHWARALAGYRFTLARLSEAGDYGARAKLIRTLGLEWRNLEARELVARTLAEEGLPDDLKEELSAFGAVLALRVGDFQAAGDFWRGRRDNASLRWLATLNLRQGRFETAAAARQEVAGRLGGRARTRELERTLDILVKGGLAAPAAELLAKNPDLAAKTPDQEFRLGLAALVGGDPDEALARLAAEQKRAGAKLDAVLYFQGRAWEAKDDPGRAMELYRQAAASPLGYYRLLAEGRLAALSGTFRRLPLAEPMADLLKSPGADGDSLGWHLWVTERLPWPWPEPARVREQVADSRPLERSRAAVDHYLAHGDAEAAFGELSAAGEALLAARTPPTDPKAARYVLLAARGGDYRLAVALMRRIKTPAGAQGLRWSHPAVLGGPVLGAWRRHGLSPQLTLSVIRTESAFDSEAISSSNARGLMQILPSTARRLAAIEGDPEPREEDLFDRDLNVRYGTAYLGELARVFGNVPLALASYNGGPFNIKAYMEAVPGRPLDLFIETLPFSESSNYVKRVIESQARYEAAYLGRYNYHDLTAPVGLPLGEPPDF
jgi:soluble lytic murein transglycosylase-like protein